MVILLPLNGAPRSLSEAGCLTRLSALRVMHCKLLFTALTVKKGKRQLGKGCSSKLGLLQKVLQALANVQVEAGHLSELQLIS